MIALRIPGGDVLLDVRPHPPDPRYMDSTRCAVAVSSDGARLATGSWDGVVRVWDLRNATEVAAFRGHNGGITSLDFYPDGKSVASASEDGTVLVWAVK